MSVENDNHCHTEEPCCHHDAEQRAPVAIPDQVDYWTCPMHPDVHEDQPVPCPICGMALEPSGISLDEGEDPELIDMRRRLWISAVLTIPVFIVAMSELIPGLAFEATFGSKALQWFQFAFAAPVVLSVSAAPCAASGTTSGIIKS